MLPFWINFITCKHHLQIKGFILENKSALIALLVQSVLVYIFIPLFSEYHLIFCFVFMTTFFQQWCTWKPSDGEPAGGSARPTRFWYKMHGKRWRHFVSQFLFFQCCVLMSLWWQQNWKVYNYSGFLKHILTHDKHTAWWQDVSMWRQAGWPVHAASGLFLHVENVQQRQLEQRQTLTQLPVQHRKCSSHAPRLPAWSRRPASVSGICVKCKEGNQIQITGDICTWYIF